MRVYFLSERPAALKLNGAYMGLIDSFEKFVEMGEGQKILAEAVPDAEYMPVNFFIDEKFFSAPPDFTEVYLTEGDAVIYISRYTKRDGEIKVIAQTQFCGGQYTLFTNGGRVYLNCEKDGCKLYPLSAGFENATLREDAVGGRPVLLAEGKGCLAAVSEEGKRVFYNPAESWECGDKLTVNVAFNTCADCRGVCTFGYDGTAMRLEKSVTKESVAPDERVLHFAFFESVLTRGNFAKYLADDLKGMADNLPDFLGGFVDVTIPYSRFYQRHGDLKAAGLVYPVADNLFKVKYYAVDLTDGKISNVYEVE